MRTQALILLVLGTGCTGLQSAAELMSESGVGAWRLTVTSTSGEQLSALLILADAEGRFAATLEIDNHTLRGVWKQQGHTLQIRVEERSLWIQFEAELDEDELHGDWKNGDGEAGSLRGIRIPGPG